MHTFLAYTLLYRAQNEPLLDPNKLHLVVIAPRLTKPYADEMRVLGVTAQAEAAGVWRLHGGAAVHPMWLLETEELAGLQHPLLTVVSPTFRRDRFAVYDSLSQVGYDDMMVYVVQQISQFRLTGKEFAMQHVGVNKEMHLALREVLRKLPLEDRLSAVSVDEIPLEERLKGIPAEDRLRGLTPEELERLRKLLQQPGATQPTTTADAGKSA